MSIKELLLDAGYEDVLILDDFLYDTALIGVSSENRAIYSYNKMVQWLIERENFESDFEAIEWIEHNVIRDLAYIGENAPIIMYQLNNNNNID